MRRLMLLRHAKSDWAAGKGGDDHERPLSARGRKAAPRVGAYMREKGYIPNLVLCSTARRTRETLDLLLPFFSPLPKLRYGRDLYLAEWPVLLEQVRKIPKTSAALLVIGHNPGLERLAVALALQPQGGGELARAERLAEKFSTGALAVFDLAVREWRSVKPGQGRLIDFVRPKDLAADDNGE
jgi:phosphohistidine phosphatase